MSTANALTTSQTGPTSASRIGDQALLLQEYGRTHFHIQKNKKVLIHPQKECTATSALPEKKKTLWEEGLDFGTNLKTTKILLNVPLKSAKTCLTSNFLV